MDAYYHQNPDTVWAGLLFTSTMARGCAHIIVWYSTDFIILQYAFVCVICTVALIYFAGATNYTIKMKEQTSSSPAYLATIPSTSSFTSDNTQCRFVSVLVIPVGVSV